MTNPDGLTVAQAIRAATDVLGAKTDTARFDAELLMAHALGVSRSELFLRQMGEPAPAGYDALIRRRAGYEPVAYITGDAGFWGLRLKVSPAVLVPRADSETLIEAAQTALADKPPRRVLDLGTGSGCLLLAALSEWPGAEGIGIDCSAEALEIAAHNVKGTGARLIQRDWRDADWADGLGRYDLILANPPYVEDAAPIEPTVREFEPAGALFAGPQGLDDYHILIPQLRELLNDGGIALVEIGQTQADAVCAIAAACGLAAAVHTDLGDRPRAIELKISLGKGAAKS